MIPHLTHNGYGIRFCIFGTDDSAEFILNNNTVTFQRGLQISVYIRGTSSSRVRYSVVQDGIEILYYITYGQTASFLLIQNCFVCAESSPIVEVRFV